MRLPSNCIFSADFIAYGPACAAAALVICNGGAPAVYSALAQGTPALAVPSNLDQIVNLRSLAWLQAVTSLHNNGLFFSRLASRDSLWSFLDHARERARRAQVMIRQFDPTAGVLHWIQALS